MRLLQDQVEGPAVACFFKYAYFIYKKNVFLNIFLLANFKVVSFWNKKYRHFYCSPLGIRLRTYSIRIRNTAKCVKLLFPLNQSIHFLMMPYFHPALCDSIILRDDKENISCMFSG